MRCIMNTNENKNALPDEEMENVSGGYTEEQAAEFISLSVKKKQRAERQAKHLFKMYGEISDNLV